MRILSFGSLNIDNVYQVDHFVQPGETMSSLSLKKHSGGKGLNQSIALARAGAKVHHAGAIGQGDGEFLKAILQDSGVDTTYLLEREDVLTGHAIIQVDKAGENCIILHGGANQTISSKEAEEIISNFDEGDFIVLQNEISSLGDIIEHAHKKGMRIVLNPSPFNEKILELPLQHVEYFILNEIEAAGLTSKSDDKYLENLAEKFPNAKFVLTLGSQGSCYWDREQSYTQDIYKVKAVDTTGAGDTYTGYFFASLANGKSVPEALDLASKASAIAVTGEGAEPSIPILDKVLKSKITI